MARSVLKLNVEDYDTIRTSLKKNKKLTKKQREVINNFDVSLYDRNLLTDLVAILEPFEYVTREFQSNEVTISKVYPCIKYLQDFLEEKQYGIKNLINFCRELNLSLTKRFVEMIYNDVFIVSTFLGNFFFNLNINGTYTH